MSSGVIVGNTFWDFDPCNQGEYSNPLDYAEACGLVLGWVNPASEKTAADQLASHYQYFHGWDDISIDENGVLLSEGDPPLYPLATTWVRNHQVLIYPYGLVGVRDKITGASVYTRMD